MNTEKNKYIEIKGAKTHNLKNISLKIPKKKLVVITGVSGSGKSSLAFDTIFAEGQRRFVESLSAYARQFLSVIQKPDVQQINGLSPAIAINQKTVSHNPRSTVGTTTEIYDYLRLLYSAIGRQYCPSCDIPVESQTIEEIITNAAELLTEKKNKVIIKAPLIINQKGTFQSLFQTMQKKGYIRLDIDGKTYLIEELLETQLEKNKKHQISLIVDRLLLPPKPTKDQISRLYESISLALHEGNGDVIVHINKVSHHFSTNHSCKSCGLSFPKLKPTSFSFNSPLGACKHCSGLGTIEEIEIDKIYNPNLTILEGGVFPLANKLTTNSWLIKVLKTVAQEHNFNLKTPIGSYSQEIFDLLFYGKGAKDQYVIKYLNRYNNLKVYKIKFKGLVHEIHREFENASPMKKKFLKKFIIEKECPVCHGTRLQPFAQAVKISGTTITEMTQLPISQLYTFVQKLPQTLSPHDYKVAKNLITEISKRLKFLIDVGLDYLTLSRKTMSLSGGESQRIRLASQIGSGLTDVLYVLDEPSIGLHPRDISRLINMLKSLRGLDNTVIVVEHDAETIKNADWIVDIGPKAGIHGGKIVAEGTLANILKSKSLTADYLNKRKLIGQNLRKEILSEKPNYLQLKGVRTHNLQNIDVKIPLNRLVFITGVSGSGKSSLISDTLIPALTNKPKPETKYEEILGTEYITNFLNIDQSPIGKTPKSNPATYTGLFTYIRDLLAQLPESKAKGLTPGKFSFNVPGGRCEKCKGEGVIKIDMQFLPPVYVECEVCKGKRYTQEILNIKYSGFSIADILDLTVEEALNIFKNHPPIKRRLEVLNRVGLGYIKLGQSALTLSGGESQRIKLAKELAKVKRGNTLYILDEPTTGLHFDDIDKLLILLQELVNKGNSVIVIEHNLEMIKYADWIIDLGPEGGSKGGQIIAEGTPKDIIKNKKSYTGSYLKKML